MPRAVHHLSCLTGAIEMDNEGNRLYSEET